LHALINRFATLVGDSSENTPLHAELTLKWGST